MPANRLFSLLIGVMACSNSIAPPAPLPDAIAAVPVITGLDLPVYLAAPAGDSRMFIVEQGGTIRLVKNGVLLTEPYLDLRSKVSTGGERGLFSLAFHPDFWRNGLVFVKYTDLTGDTRVERYHAAPLADVADANSGTTIMSTPQPFANHNGGMLLFGPDRMLWIGMGDGGSGGDPQGNGQRLNTLLGKMLRIDVDRGTPYRIPSDNPYVAVDGARGEIWGIGLRNPWRYSFDHATGLLYVGDVGQNLWEEVHVVPSTKSRVNFGWRIMEGLHCFETSSCDQSGLDLPVVEYGHSEGCSVTGGFVYRGSKVPGIRGHYFYSDLCPGFLRSFRYVAGSATDHRVWDVGALGNVSSFGEDGTGELYILSYTSGTVYQIKQQ
jgi:glucose/arabinose dehydrogenase